MEPVREYGEPNESKQRSVFPTSLSIQLMQEIEFHESIFETQLKLMELEKAQAIKEAHDDTICIANAWQSEMDITNSLKDAENTVFSLYRITIVSNHNWNVIEFK
jgi:hypothetical protein